VRGDPDGLMMYHEPPAIIASSHHGFTSAVASAGAPATRPETPRVDISKGHRVAGLTVIISPMLSRTAVELDGKVVAWDVTHHEGGTTWTVRVRVTPLDGRIFRVVRHGSRVSIVPAMGLGPGQTFVTSPG
jgi:hypothetical protein